MTDPITPENEPGSTADHIAPNRPNSTTSERGSTEDPGASNEGANLTPITPAYLDELDALSEAATEGPWRFPVGGDVMSQGDECILSLPRGSEENLAFIAAARQAVPRLVKALREAGVQRYYLLSQGHARDKAYERMKARAEAAEAEVNDLDEDRVFACVWAMKAEARAEAAEAEVEKLREAIARRNREGCEHGYSPESRQ